MFPNIDPKKMQAMMKQMGIAQEEIEATKVTIETPNQNIVITDPNVVKINMQGNTNFQISGNILTSDDDSDEEDDKGDENDEDDENQEDKIDEDIKTIMEKTNCLEDEAKLALEKADGDLTEALLSLS